MIRWFKQYFAISRNSFVHSLGDPFFLTLILVLLVSLALFASLPSFTFGGHLRLVRDQSLALIFAGGCIASSLGAVRILVEDIRRGAASVLLSRPVGAIGFILGKWTGLVSAVMVVHFTAVIAMLWVTRFMPSEHDILDTVTISFYVASIILAIAMMAVKHYLFGGCYVWQANVALLCCFLTTFLIANFIAPTGSGQSFGENVDWITAQGGFLLACGIIIFISTIIPLTILFDVPVFLIFCSSLFFLGLLGEYIITTGTSHVVTHNIAAIAIPNWQFFWISDRLAENIGIGWGYWMFCIIHTILWTFLSLSIAVLIFNKREVTD
ncbi:MAG: hypothetical protein U9O87_09530 [Verrucomicrobiota bacterium]|nr:hypothetical protein [Verrucomicrobiota bacterium]